MEQKSDQGTGLKTPDKLDQEVRARDFKELHEILSKLVVHFDPWIFRGQASSEWPLLPKAGRVSWPEGADDLRLFQGWKRRAIEYASYRPDSDWDWLALAQHHGLATRLLDWTLNPLAATFFAIAELENAEGALYAYRTSSNPLSYNQDINSFKGLGFILPRGVTQRISRQAGLFTVHSPPSLELTPQASGGTLTKILIPADAKRQLRRQLNLYGINRLSLFPDLDGLSEYMNWALADSILDT